MGNCVSQSKKKKQLEAAEKEEKRVDTALDNTKSLQDRIHELQSQNATLEKKRDKEVANLRTDLKCKDDEILAQSTQLDDQKIAMSHLEEKVGMANLASDQKPMFKFGEPKLDNRAREEAMELKETRTELSQLKDKVQILERENESLTGWLSAEKKAAKKELTSVMDTAAQDLAEARSEAAAETLRAKEKATRELQAAEKTAEEAHKEKGTAIAELKKVVEHMKAMEDERDTLRAGLDSARAELESTTSDLESTKAHLESTLATLATTSAQLETFQSQDSNRPTSSILPDLSENSYYDSVRFSVSSNRDFRVSFSRWNNEFRIHIRQWQRGAPMANMGIRAELRDIRELARILPDVVRKGEIEEGGG